METENTLSTPVQGQPLPSSHDSTIVNSAALPEAEPVSQNVSHTLPDELIEIIPQLSWNREWQSRSILTNGSLVCVQWRPIAQQLLFREVVLVMPSDAKLFSPPFKPSHC
ncbi:hypothetical protein FRC03_006073 [Tulasnella sp. 419]|nr:hypothetical protein FRC03_006073 [Tulasnella sp. 419]